MWLLDFPFLDRMMSNKRRLGQNPLVFVLLQAQ